VAERVLLVHDDLPIMASGLPAMAARLRDGGVDAEVWNLFAERRAGFQRDLADELRDVAVLGISVHWFYQLPGALKLARRAMELEFEGFVVLGGFTASLFAGELVDRHAAIDGVVRGDGERPLEVLAQELLGGTRRFERVPNLTWRDGGVRENPLSYVGGSAEVDQLSFGRLDTVAHLEAHLDASSWRSITGGSPGIDLDLDRTLYLCGGRGCSVDCVTCGGGRRAHRLHSGRERFCFRSPSRIADDVERAAALGCTSIHACFDPTPNGPHWFAFMDELEQRALRTTMIFESFGLPDEAFLTRFSSCFERGLLVLSPETAHAEIRRRVKGFSYDNDALDSVLERAVDLGIQVQVFLGYFVPHEGVRDVLRSREWSARLENRHGLGVRVLHYPYSTDPGSPLARDPGAHGCSCALSTAADYERELPLQEPWTGNLLRHFPGKLEPSEWRAVSLALEMDTACRKELPDTWMQLDRRTHGRTGEFLVELARRLLDTVPERALTRERLASIVRRATGEMP
jgi:hypothetical protein